MNTEELNMTPYEIKAFFLGAQKGEKPLRFLEAMDELFQEDQNAWKNQEKELKALWSDLESNQARELKNFFPVELEGLEFLETAKRQLDFFLTAFSLAGTHVDSLDDEDLIELLEELEDSVEDIEDFLAEEDPSPEDTAEMKEFLLEAWSDFWQVRGI